jgi:hypothetical protein
MAKRKKSGARPEMKLGKRFSSCRGKRKTLITCFGSLPALGSETGGTHYRPTGGWMCDARWRREEVADDHDSWGKTIA